MDTKKRRIFAAVFLVVAVTGFVVRHYNEKAERRKREELFRSLATYQSQQRLGMMPTPSPTPDDSVEETRDMFDGELPREQFEQISQAVGGDFKLMEVAVTERGLTANLSTDSATVKQYERRKGRKSVEGPREVRIVGDGKLDDSLYEASSVNFSLIPKLSKEAVERAGIPGAKVETARFNYPIIRYKGESPEWTFYVAGGEGDARQSKFVTFDSKGKFKRMF